VASHLPDIVLLRQSADVLGGLALPGETLEMEVI